MNLSQISVIFLCGTMPLLASIPPETSEHPIYAAYGRLRQDVLGRSVAIHKIPPSLESGFLKLYPLLFSMLVVDVHVIDEINQVVTLQVYFDLTWQQKELAWNAYSHDNITNIRVDSNEIWTPQFWVGMGLETSFTLDVDGTLNLSHEGWVTFQKLQYLHFSCDINFVRYPFDDQVCKVGFHPIFLPYPKTEIFETNFSLSKIYNQSGEWAMTRVDFEFIHYEDNNVSTEVPFSTLVLKRDSMYYVITIIFPMVLTSVMIPLVFLMPAESGEKISYLVAIFTSTAVFLNFISEVMPRSLSQMPYLAMLLIEVFLEGLLAMLASLLVLNTYIKEWKAQESKTRMYPSGKIVTVGDGKLAPLSQSMATKISSHDQRTITAQALDKAFFIVFMFAQIAFLFVLFLCTGWLEHVVLSNKQI